MLLRSLPLLLVMAVLSGQVQAQVRMRMRSDYPTGDQPTGQGTVQLENLESGQTLECGREQGNPSTSRCEPASPARR